MSTKKATAAETTTYLIEKGNEKLRITVPKDWKVTFGPIVPGGQRRGYDGSAPNCLRFYESNDKQRAIFTGVTSFRDTSIPVEKLHYKVESTTDNKKNHKSESSKHTVEREEEWLPF